MRWRCSVKSTTSISFEQAKVSREDKQAFRNWADNIAAWLNSSDHISVKYGVEYDGVGNRAVVTRDAWHRAAASLPSC